MMKSTAYFLCTILLLTFFAMVNITYAQDGDRDGSISKLRPVERHLEQLRDQLKDEIKKVESNDGSGRSTHVVMPAGGGFGAITYAVIPRAVFEARLGVNTWIGETTLNQAFEITRTVNNLTKAFPATAREELRRIEESLADVKRELLALLNKREGVESESGLAANIDLSGAWNVTAKGNNGLSSTATLRLTKNADGSYSGSFDWRSASYSGVEKVTGRLDPATRILTLSGAVVGGNITSGNYRIKVAEGGRSMENGTWSGSDGGGRWIAGK